MSPSIQLHRLRGLWFEVRIAARPITAAGQPVDVVRDAGLSTLAPKELYGRPHVYAAAKRQLARRELKAYGLANDPDA